MSRIAGRQGAGASEVSAPNFDATGAPNFDATGAPNFDATGAPNLSANANRGELSTPSIRAYLEQRYPDRVYSYDCAS
jgi:hypothetical protein